MNNKTRISFELPDNLLEQTRVLSQNNMCSVSSIIRQSLNAYLERK